MHVPGPVPSNKEVIPHTTQSVTGANTRTRPCGSSCAIAPSSLYCHPCAFAGWVAPAAMANVLGDAEPEAALGGLDSLAEKSLVVRRQDNEVSATAQTTRCETVLCAIARSSWLVWIPVGKLQIRVAAREASAPRARRAGAGRTLALRPWPALRLASRGSKSKLLSRAGRQR